MSSKTTTRNQATSSDTRYVAHAPWLSSRYWEAAETTRLNSAHWTHAEDASINEYLEDQLSWLRRRSIYETRNNGILAGMQATHADDIWGQDGPLLQVQSDSDAYNEALERVWREWFAAPTPRPNVSGAQLGKLWVRNLWRCGEYICRIVTDPQAAGPVSMRLWPTAPRRLATPANYVGRPNIIMGIEFDGFERPVRYWIDDEIALGTQGAGYSSQPWPADLIIHEFLLEEDAQARGFPLLATGIQIAADLRDYDDQVQDAARQIADQCGLLYNEDPGATPLVAPETADIERRTIRTMPPGWKPFVYPATQPAVQYPDYRSERQLELGRPVGMPRLMVRLDASKHSWASARLDMTTYRRATQCLQAWFSGSEQSVGVLNRLVDMVAAEARFSVPELRGRPPRVSYAWTWPQLPDVEPLKTAQSNMTDLQTGAKTLTELLADRKKTLQAHIEEKRREQEAFIAAGLPLPSWMTGAADPIIEQTNQAMIAAEGDG